MAQAQLSDFPKFFSGEAGKVDYALLQEICSIRAKPQKSVRELLATCSSIKVNADEAFEKLADIVARKDFRERWYEDSHNKKNFIWTLFDLAHRYVANKYKNLEHSSEQLSKFYTKKAAKTKGYLYFPKLQNIQVLVDQVKIVSDVNPTHAAIFCWATIESALWSSRSYTAESSLLLFQETLLSALRNNQMHDVVELLSCGTWIESAEIPKPVPKLIVSEPKKTTEIQNAILPARRKHATVIKIEGYLAEIERKFHEFDKQSTLLSEKSSELINVRSVVDSVDELKIILESIRNIYSEICKNEEFVIDLGFSKFIEVMKSFRILLTLNFPKELTPENRLFWLQTIRKTLLVENDLLIFSTDFSSKKIDIKEKFNSLLHEKELSLDQMQAELVSLSTDLSICEFGVTAHSNIYESIKNNYKNINWNPLLNTSSLNLSWSDLGKILIREGKFGHELGIIVRHSFSPLSKGFSNLVLDTISKPLVRNKLERIIESFNCLTPGQIENLEQDSIVLRNFFAIVELHAFLEMAPVSSNEAFKYWSIAPLNEISSSSLQDTFGEFFQSVYAICAKTPERMFGMAEFRLTLLKANATDEKDGIQLDERDLRIRLDEILLFYKRGQNTYGELWSRAYATVVAPLKQYLNNCNLDTVAEKIYDLRDSFKIDDHLSDWKLYIPEHLRKRSEYDKHIRSQVEGKILELVGWANDYHNSISNKQIAKEDEVHRLVQSIRNVYSSQEQSSSLLHIWFELILLQEREANRLPWSLSLSNQADWDEITLGHTSTPLNPRSFIDNNSTFGSLYGDKIIQYFGHNTVAELALNYADLGLYEEYFSLSSSTSEPISLDLDRRVELEVDELEIAQLHRIELLSKKQLGFSESDESIDTYLSELREFLKERSWNQLERELTEVEVLVLDIEYSRADKVVRDQLGQEIVELGGNYDLLMSKDDLQKARNVLYETTLSRRVHLEPIKRIVEFSQMDSDIVNATRSTIISLNRHSNLPDKNQSEYLAYLFEQIVTPLLGELTRYRTLLPTYSSKLKSLTINIMVNLEAFCFRNGAVPPQIAIFEALADEWNELPRKGEDGIDLISSKFIASGLIWSETTSINLNEENLLFDRTNRSQVAEENLIGDSGSIIARFIQKLKSASASKLSSGNIVINNEKLNQQIKAAKWSEASNTAYRLYIDPLGFSQLQQKEVLTNWAISSYLNAPEDFDVESMAALFRLINSNRAATGVQYLLPTKSSKGLLGEMLARFIKKIASSMGGTSEKSNIQDQISLISGNISAYGQFKIFLRIAFSSTEDERSTTARAFWDHFAGDSRQAEIRAAFLTLVWKSSLPNILAQCLVFSPIEIPPRKAAALASVADQILETGKFDLIQSFMDMRTSVGAKPFELFVASMLSMVPASLEQAAELSIVGKLNKVELNNVWRATLSILPRKSDCPDTIKLTLEQHSPVRFIDGELEYTLIGPFFEPGVVPLEFVTNDVAASLFTLEVVCDAISITGKVSKYTVNLNIDLSTGHQFKRLNADEIEEAFSNFPEYQMRGADYVARIEDERKIEKALFGRTVRSLWISSPRRSGKTTMLYRILDAFSHKAGRDSAVIYLTLDKSFSNVSEFNSWVWTRLRTIPANKELRALYPNFEDLGRQLPWDADAGTFISALSDCLLSGKEYSRIIFLIDEIDKFAAMHYTGGARKDTANEIMWQIRQLIGERRDVGFVFAGSSAAKRIFVTNSDSPFFNGISLLELTPFSSRTLDEERCAREIVTPVRTHAVYSLPKPSLEHLIWVCAGIPYYMKLVSGATMAVARQSHILISDINDGLRALLQRGTGVMKLDEMSGEPGSDELRTMAIETGQDKLLTLAVLYSIAESYSALGGQPISRASVAAQDSPLITRYHLPRKNIERGLDLCIELGFLKILTDRYGEIEFSIPILGESIRNACGKLWAHIDHELREIAKEEQL